jgi:hypothetical protein
MLGGKRRSAMKYLHTLLILFLFITFPSSVFSSGPGTLRTSLVQGNVQVKTENASDGMSLLLNMPLMEGDEILVPESGRMEVQMSDGSLFRLDENSTLLVHSIRDDAFRFSLVSGHAYINFKGDHDGMIRIETPFSFVRSSEKSKFRVDVPDAGALEVAVLEGTVFAAGRNEMIEVQAGETLSLGKEYYADLSPLRPSDAWERWNRDRDRRFEENVYSARYLPEELRTYSYDFDEYGDWVYVRKHGYVWKPSLVVTSGWSPYRVGRWRWRHNDYVWVSHEPWGWAPYHYGRWAFTVSLGWFWVPPARGAVYWGPGYVGWIHTPRYVSWVPLAPGDIYYGYGYYGPGSVNIININVHTHKKLKKRGYRHIHVDNAVTVVHRKSFLAAKYVPYKSQYNPAVRVLRSFRKTGERPKGVSFLPLTRKDYPEQISAQRTTDRRYKVRKREDVSSQRQAHIVKTRSQSRITSPVKRTERISIKRRTYRNRDADFVKKVKPVEKVSRKGNVSRDRGKRYAKRDVIIQPEQKQRRSSLTVPKQSKSRRAAQVNRNRTQKGTDLKRVTVQRGMKGYTNTINSSQRRSAPKGLRNSSKMVRFNTMGRRR